MSANWARLWFGITTLCVVIGIAIQLPVAYHSQAGHYRGGAASLNVFSFFTVQSNVLVGVTSLLLAINLHRPNLLFRVLRLSGLVAITITGIVYHVALSGLLELDTWGQTANQALHTAVPILAVVGWLIFGPRGCTSARIAKLSLVFPILWLAFTLIKGSVNNWYPYPFIDVATLGYLKVALNCLWIAMLFLGLAAGATVLDPRLSQGEKEIKAC